MKTFFPVAFLILSSFIVATEPAYAQVNLGTSSSTTNPERSGDATTGLFSSTTGAVSISSGGTEKMRVNGTGVGIGTASPATLLDVYSASATTGIRNIATFALGTGSGGGLFADASTIPTATGQRVGGFYFGAYDGTTSYNPSAITGWSSEAWSSTDKGSYIQFETTATGSTARTERMLIDSSGNVAIGTTSATNPLTVNGVIQSTTGGVKFPDGTTQTTAATAAASTGMVLLATVNASAQSTVVFNATYLTSTYNKYVIEYDSLYTSDSGEVDLVLSANNGSSYLTTSGSYYDCPNANANGFKVSATQNSSTYVGMGTIKFMGPGITTQPMIDMRDTASSGFEGVVNQDCFGTLNNGSTTYSINAVKFYDAGGGTITGNFHLYGLAGT